jgi:hypothetical protein
MSYAKIVAVIALMLGPGLNVTAQDAITTFTLVSGKKSKVFTSRDFIQVQNDTLVNDKIKTGQITGEFLYIKNNNFFLKPMILEDDVKSTSYKWFSENTDSIIGYREKNISRIVYDTHAGTVGAVGFWISGISAFVVSPLVSIKKGGKFDLQKCLTISGISLGSMVLSAGVIILFGDRSLEVSPTSASKKRRWVVHY